MRLRDLIPDLIPVFLVATLAWSAEAAAEPAWDGYVESTQYPIRVHYTNSAGLAAAQQALGYAEDTWEAQVEQMGFAAPTSEDASGVRHEGLWIYLDPDYPYARGEPIADNPDTPQTDCTARVVVATLTPTWYFEVVIHHESNHAFEMAADCGESPFAFENTTVAVTTLEWPDEAVFIQYMLPAFQAYPYHGLACTFRDTDRQYYQYGASLFQLFLEDYYGNYDGTLLSAIWDAAMQDGTVSVGGMGISMDVDNDPNLLDAIVSVLDGPSLDEVFTTFAQWRYFVGDRDDGEHFTYGDLWTGGEVVLDSEWKLNDLPLDNEAPVNPPNVYGTDYLTLDLNGIDDEHGVRFSLMGDPAVAWNVDAILMRSDGTAEVETMPADDDELTLDDLTDYEQIVFVVSNLGDGDYNSDSPSCGAGSRFAYDLEEVATAVPPVIDSVDPTQLAPGNDYSLWVYGNGFVDGATVDIAPTGVDVTAVTFVDETTLAVEVTVAADAVAGGRDLTVTNPNGLSDALNNAVAVFVPDVGPSDDGGCSCQTTDSGATAGFLLWLLVLGLFRRRSRHRR